MSAFRRVLVLGLVCVGPLVSAQESDVASAVQVLGPQWKQISRAAGMVFAGTVLNTKTIPPGSGNPVPVIQTKFHVDRAIVGVRAGQVLVIREWAGTWSTAHPTNPGQRILVFLYPPSRLGLTSAVGGPLGQVALDANGEIAVPRAWINQSSHASKTPLPSPGSHITLQQLERAVRGARKE